MAGPGRGLEFGEFGLPGQPSSKFRHLETAPEDPPGQTVEGILEPSLQLAGELHCQETVVGHRRFSSRRWNVRASCEASHVSRPRLRGPGDGDLRLRPGSGYHSGLQTRSVRPGLPYGRVAELADAQDSGSCVRKDVGVQVPLRPQRDHRSPPLPAAALPVAASVERGGSGGAGAGAHQRSGHGRCQPSRRHPPKRQPTRDGRRGFRVTCPKSIATIDRAQFQTITDSVVAELDGAGTVVSEPPESGHLVGAATLYRLTVSTWRSGVVTFAEGVIEMADEGGTGEERIYAGLQQVAAGDVLYLRFLEELDRPEVPDPIATMPGLAVPADDHHPVSLARLYATAAGAQNSLLALRADLAVGQVTSRARIGHEPRR